MRRAIYVAVYVETTIVNKAERGTHGGDGAQSYVGTYTWECNISKFAYTYCMNDNSRRDMCVCAVRERVENWACLLSRAWRYYHVVLRIYIVRASGINTSSWGWNWTVLIIMVFGRKIFLLFENSKMFVLYWKQNILNKNVHYNFAGTAKKLWSSTRKLNSASRTRSKQIALKKCKLEIGRRCHAYVWVLTFNKLDESLKRLIQVKKEKHKIVLKNWVLKNIK